MKLTIITQNSQGLNGDLAIDLLKNYYKNHLKDLEVLCIQEHKLRGRKLETLKGKFWPGAKCLAVEADVAYNNAANESGAGSGGVCMWIAPKLQHMISEVGQSRSGRAQWTRLSGVPGGDIAILNVYAPNQAQARCELWAELIDTLPKDCRWVFIGDWNFVEKSRDKSRNNNQTMSHEEKRLFEVLTRTCDVHDPFPQSNRIKYSWDNRRVGSSRTMARLDRIYSPKDLAQSVAVDEYSILGDCTLLDHLLVRRNLELTAAAKRQSPYVMNTSFLKEQEVKDGVRREWTTHSNLSFFGKLRRCVKFYKQYCIRRATEARREETQLRARMEEAVTNIQVDPANNQWQAQLAECADALQNFENRKLEGQLLRSRIKWKAVGDKCSKEFFQATREKSTASHIVELTDKFGQEHTSQAALQQICQEYYKTLYTARQDTLAIEGAKHQALCCVEDSLSGAMKDILHAPISLGELKNALDEIA
jgi:exonuclease III